MPQNSLKIVMMGTGPFAVPTFRRLLDSRHSIAGLVTRPSKPAHGRRSEPVNPMLEVAVQHQLQVLTPENINTEAARQELALLAPELLVVCDYGQILKPDTLSLARLGGINLHASLLPKYRGAAPVQWAIYQGETETGNTVIRMTAGLDAGPTIAQQRTDILATETAGELEARLALMGAELVLTAIDQIVAGTDRPLSQQSSQATKAPRLRKDQGLVDWTRTAAQISAQVRAFQPWPTTYTFWPRAGKEPLRLILTAAVVSDLSVNGAQPGEILEAQQRLVVATGGGALELVSVQPAGKRAFQAAEFLRGYPTRPGEFLGQVGSSSGD